MTRCNLSRNLQVNGNLDILFIEHTLNVHDKLKLMLLPLLEIKSLYAVNICKSKEDSKASQNSCYYTHVVWVIAEVVLDEIPDLLIGLARHLDKILHITILRNNQSINRPCHRANPVVPYPPFWDFLNKKVFELIHIDSVHGGLRVLESPFKKAKQ